MTQMHEGRPGIGLVTGHFYPHSFTLADLDQFERFVDEHEACMWYSDVALEQVPGTIAVRHDVDHSIVHAYSFAEWENERGINATYFILPTAAYWNGEATREAALAIQALGHEIGVHNDAFSEAARRQIGQKAPGPLDNEAIKLLKEWTDEMRSWGLKITGCADHGGAEPRNVDLWVEPYNRTPQEAGLAYEAYALHRSSNYISDNRGGWRAPLEKVEGKQTHVLIHPCHWRLP